MQQAGGARPGGAPAGTCATVGGAAGRQGPLGRCDRQASHARQAGPHNRCSVRLSVNIGLGAHGGRSRTTGGEEEEGWVPRFSKGQYHLSTCHLTDTGSKI